ncbi:MAG: response regulator [Syntrophobacteraceae bacterium]
MADIKPARENVLVVDDEAWICEIVSQVLLSEAYEPIVCTHPGLALSALERTSFPLAFIDINMPEMDGIELAARVKEKRPQCEIVLMTGYATIENAVQAIKIGATDYLRKPFSTGEIGFCLRRFAERKALREQVRQAEERYHRLVHNIPTLIFMLHRDLRLEFINDTCIAMLGYSPSEAMQSPGWLIERICPEDRERVLGLVKSVFESGRASFSTECRLAHKEDHIIHALVRCIAQPGREAAQGPECLEGIIVDITNRVVLEKTLVQREKLNTLGAIAAEVAHEIRNPLVCIGGFARRLQKRLPDSQETGIILRQCERLEKILGRIRDYIRPVEVRPRECSVNAIIAECVELLSPEIRGKGVDFRLDLDEDVSCVHTDHDILAEVIINLVRNALAATAPGGDALIRTFETEQNLHIEIKNKGGRKDLKKPDLLFLPFDQGGESIGLPLCYQLLKNMGCLLACEEKDQHVIFTVSLPTTGEASFHA